MYKIMKAEAKTAKIYIPRKRVMARVGLGDSRYGVMMARYIYRGVLTKRLHFP